MEVGKNKSIFKKVIVKKKPQTPKQLLGSPTHELYNTYAVELLICMTFQTTAKTLLTASKVC